MFWIRLAHHAFAVDDFNDALKHFTVFNYEADVEVVQILYTDFIAHIQGGPGLVALRLWSLRQVDGQLRCCGREGVSYVVLF